MSAFLGRTFLRLLFHTVQQHRRAPGGQPTPAELNALAEAAHALTHRDGEVVFTLDGDALFLGDRMLVHPSVELRGLVRVLRECGIDSVTLLETASTGDLGHFAALLAGSEMPRRRGGVRINERPLRPTELRPVTTTAVRGVYAEAVDTLQRVTAGLAVDIDRAGRVVEDFLSVPEAEQRASLLLATTQNCDEIVVYHSVNVCLLSLALGRHIGIGGRQLHLLGVGALLHDVGRIGRSDGIAEKSERLSGDDWSTIRMHPQDGAEAILAASRSGEEILARVALEHHLRQDGTGYPEMPGTRPHLFASVVAVADAYDAITSDRPHRPGRTPRQAIGMLLDGAGTVHDPDLVRAFVHLLGGHPPGSLIRLTGGELAVVVAGEPGAPSAMIVQNAAGDDVVDSGPFALEPGRIAGDVLAADAGVVPGSLVEQVIGPVPAH